jgi:hypothetical protein
MFGAKAALDAHAQRQRVLMLMRKRDEISVAQHVSIMPVKRAHGPTSAKGGQMWGTNGFVACFTKPPRTAENGCLLNCP